MYRLPRVSLAAVALIFVTLAPGLRAAADPAAKPANRSLPPPATYRIYSQGQPAGSETRKFTRTTFESQPVILEEQDQAWKQNAWRGSRAHPEDRTLHDARQPDGVHSLRAAWPAHGGDDAGALLPGPRRM